MSGPAHLAELDALMLIGGTLTQDQLEQGRALGVLIGGQAQRGT